MSCTTSMLAGRYRLVEQVAVGGVGEVWRGLDVVLERPVAIKLLRAEHAGNLEALARFRAEARHAGSVSHPGITQIHDYGDADPPHPPYLVMELVDGQSLAVLLAGGPLGPAHAMDVRLQLRQLGLRVRVLWQPSHDQPDGTVLSVQPSGRVPADSVVTVTAARQAGVFGQVNGHDHGDGGNGGGGGEQGGGD